MIVANLVFGLSPDLRGVGFDFVNAPPQEQSDAECPDEQIAHRRLILFQDIVDARTDVGNGHEVFTDVGSGGARPVAWAAS